MALLEARGLTKRFGGLTAVADVSLTVEKSERVGLIGPNGAGKTTLFNLLACTIKPDAGQIIFRGHRIDQLRPENAVSLGIARTFQIMRPFPELSAVDNVLIGALNRHRQIREGYRIARETLDFVGLSAQAEVPAKGLSTGQLKRLELAKAMATKPSLLLLDEITAGVDLAATERVIDLLNRLAGEDITFVLIEHRMEVLSQLCTRLVCLDQGKIIADGSPAVVLADTRVAASYLGKAYVAHR